MDLDAALKEIGQFGLFQGYYFTLLVLPVVLSAFRGTEYVFTTMNILHRCRVPQCEGASGPTQFSPSWLSRAVPSTPAGTPEPCLRYRPLNTTAGNHNNSCPADLFHPPLTQHCNSWVFAETTHTIAHDFNMMCPEDYYKLTLYSSIAVFISVVGIPLTGYLSDRVGRKTVLVYGCSILCLTGLVRSFATSFYFLMFMEAVDGILVGSAYSPAFVLGLETLAPSKRLLGSMLISLYFPLGEMLLALVMWLVQDWRTLLRVFYGPMLVIVSLHWLLPESIRWLHTKGKVEKVKEVFVKMAKMNKTEDKLQNVLNSLQAPESADSNSKEPISAHPRETEPKVKKSLRFGAVLRSTVIMYRFGICALLWVANIFTYYGISQNAASFGDNRYVSYILVSVVEIPAYVFSLYAPDWKWLGRRGSMVWSFLLGGAACLSMMLISPDHKVLSITMFLIGKFCSTYTITVIYIYTAEVFPTEVRHSLLSLCSMCGRIGTIISQQTPLMTAYLNPMVVFGGVSVVGGLLSLTCPETLGTKMPNTIEEAEDIGKASGVGMETTTLTPQERED